MEGLRATELVATGTFGDSLEIAEAWDRAPQSLGAWLESLRSGPVTTTLTVADATSLPLRLTQTVRSDEGERPFLDVEFFDWGSATPVLAPEADRIHPWETVAQALSQAR